MALVERRLPQPMIPPPVEFHIVLDTEEARRLRVLLRDFEGVGRAHPNVTTHGKSLHEKLLRALVGTS